MAKTTKTDILNTAELLFSQQGFTQTSMREITTDAGVNLASVNYHYGSKKNLIQAVLKRYFDVLIPDVELCLKNTDVVMGVKGVDAVLRALIVPMVRLSDVRPNGTAIFVQLLGRGYNETQGHLRRFIMSEYGHAIRALVAAIQQCLPTIPPEALFWRLHFAMGSFVFSMASSQALTEIVESDFHRHIDISEVISQLVPFVAQGLAGNLDI
ncbi:TetR/AcrR family transcriptional regulator [Alteromonas sp. A079]|uniref:TetR/AcrR family transcriptional regulator n=1 Tax=Alteromonas sp. A079 TaxID=3410268 RepID=UPI003BA38933